MTQTTPKIFVFVLMPFDTKFDDIYELGIKAACSDAGAYCERVDEQIFEESILNRIYNQISNSLQIDICDTQSHVGTPLDQVSHTTCAHQYELLSRAPIGIRSLGVGL